MGTNKYNILFIDDSDMNNFLTKAIIKVDELPIEAHFCEKVDDALAYLNNLQSNNTQFPQFIFCDINLPGKNGFHFTEEYQQSFFNQFPDTKVFFMSALIGKEEEEKAANFNCVKGLYEKPFTIDIAKSALGLMAA